MEDYFDSAYWFCALSGQGPCLFAHSTSGLLHFSRTAFNGSDWIKQPRPGANRSTWVPGAAATVERLSAYRFFDQEVVGFSDGGKLLWRNGDVGTKPFGCPPGTQGCKPTSEPVSSTAVRSYAWVYTWPLDASAPPSPPLSPPISCPDASVCGGGPHQLPNPAPGEAAPALDAQRGLAARLAFEGSRSHWDV